MDRKRLGWLLVGLGATLLVLSALADPIGIGEGSGVGYKQVIGAVLGAALAVVGLALVVRRAPGSTVDTTSV